MKEQKVTESARGEIFQNIEFGWIIYILAFMATALVFYALYTRMRLWKMGKPENRFENKGQVIKDFIKTGIADGVFHRRFFRARNPATPAETGWWIVDRLGHSRFLLDSWAGINHFLMFAGAVFLLIATGANVISHYIYEFLEGHTYLAISCIGDVGGVLMLLGVFGAALRRYIKKPAQVNNVTDDRITLAMIAVVVLTGYIVEGLRQVIADTPSQWAQWSFLGYGFAQIFDSSTMLQYQIIWWIHSILVIVAVVYIALTFNKLSHILVSPINVFFRSTRPKGALAPLDMESPESFGAAKIEDFTWKQLMDLDACTQCSRCQANCPAYLSQKKLSPKKVIGDLKSHLCDVYPVTVKTMINGKLMATESRKDMGKEVVTEEVIWDCTTCRACEEVCPVFVEHIDKIMDMRRDLVLEQSRVPESAENALRSIMDRGHPWKGSLDTRPDVAQKLGTRAMAEDNKVDVLFYMGCTTMLQERPAIVGTATAKLLKAAGIKFGVLGPEETCCGEPARRLGEEYLFQSQARKNIALFRKYGVKKIVTVCPHCFNTLKNEYPQFGGDFEVVHHSQLIAELLMQGKLRPSQTVNKSVTYHDPCYLGRYQEIYEEPRGILTAIPGLQMVEMERNHRQSFCCGGGGGRTWLEETGSKICELRVDEAIKTKADMLVTACPFCLKMMEYGKTLNQSDSAMNILDIAELVESAL
ncbi:MAG: heterodisulfide reductase-related iron-sulfur binding cluster [Dehalococcoidia bacterium]|nr:heterodisulfide reductase-related iron-sulfur binding cluster [Dehalococcoidia bacterium]